MKKPLLLTLAATLAVTLLGSTAHAATGTGTGVLGDTKSINTTLKSGTYYLEDQTKYMYTQKGSSINTYNYRNGISAQYFWTDADNVWNTTTQRAAVDAHYYTGLVYDYLYNKLGRNSYDGNGAPMNVGVHYSTNYNNIFWNGSQLICGDGDGVTFRPLCGALDIVAHEWFHAVIDYTAGFVYNGQSGALSESWADAFGATLDNNDWLIGEDVYTPATAGDAVRSMSNPNAYGDPDHMDEYVTTTADNGGVHTNSGIPNKAFYNFATSIGSRDIAMKIWYIALRDYMTSTATFHDARLATLAACAQLYGSSSTYYTRLAEAWTAVGVL
ncbi:M4 family metallopeptidase [Tumebacillus sp. DT12]|uniref:Neutral metalloproteinase n=1 Tax=Tumebacillus lacus TaxID=2995335 RepID=A0ABT3WYA5_9BACL|nr:M4 family metallopeptidase [Tumebacillus lacus]MCX7569653.1 M4 family metallopeptidase [Tumebacillus lacus]